MAAKSKCVHCGEIVDEWTRDCPKCGRPVANLDAPLVSDLRSKFKTSSNRKRNIMPLVIGVIVIAIALLLYFYQG